MPIPVTIAFDGLPESEAVQRAVWKHAAELERFSERVTSCQVTIRRPHHRGQQGDLYTVSIDMTVPGEELVVNRQRRFDHAHEDVYVAMRDAFRAARRKLEDHARRWRGQIKSHAGASEGVVAKLFPREGYGFITAPDYREIYFHRNAIIAGDFGRMKIGDRARFTEEPGEKGPQASSVHILHSHRAAPRRRETPA